MNALGDFKASGAAIAQGLKDAGIELPQQAQDALGNVDSVTREDGNLTVEGKSDFKVDLPGPDVKVDKEVTAKIGGSGKDLSVPDIKGVKYGPMGVHKVEAKGGEGGKVDVTAKVGWISKTFHVAPGETAYSGDGVRLFRRKVNSCSGDRER